MKKGNQRQDERGLAKKAVLGRDSMGGAQFNSFRTNVYIQIP